MGLQIAGCISSFDSARFNHFTIVTCGLSVQDRTLTAHLRKKSLRALALLERGMTVVTSSYL
jgi:hypothetical protein